MKEIIQELYNIEIISFIKITDKVYKIKTSDKDYALKYIEQTSLEGTIEKLKLIKIDKFVYPISNLYNQYVSSIEGINFIILPWMEEENVLMKDLKLDFYLTFLAELHNKSFYTIKVNSSFFEETYNYIGDKIDEVENKLENYISKVEKLDYKSPSEWLFLLNYPLYKSFIDKANKHLENFRDKIESKDNVRMAFTYNNFNYKHILLKENKIIGIENVELTPPIYDIFSTFISLNELNVDLKNYYQKYFNKFILDDYEKEWLLSLLYIPKIEEFSKIESVNLDVITSSLNYIKNSEEIAELIKIEKEENDDK